MENFFHFSLQEPYKVVLHLGEVVLYTGEVVLAWGGLGFVDTCYCTTDHSIPALFMYTLQHRLGSRGSNRATDVNVNEHPEIIVYGKPGL